ncbi:MAG: lipoyl(octanoyl) transferase LipB [Bacteroidales bacterium]|nr:lipoyl(octanoyl) transferase LipB [Bacteroidales bacterium]MBO5916000.1 lipoyl(octanoyl) transferase LipB [Bacteroidales bacterium]MBO7182523.1 lipoyl(octanoyl) transferase LipB [Bacteroidales bacterium]
MTIIDTDWGLISYQEAWDKQKSLFQERLTAKAQGDNHLPDVLVSCEHHPVLTLGKSGQIDNLLVSEQILRQRGVEFFQIERGGDITYHGPGQLVMYPIFDLQHFCSTEAEAGSRRGIGLKEYIWRLEEAVILFLKDFGIEAERLEGATGVWLDAHGPRARKICAIGVKASRFVTMHGLAFNINTDLSYFQLINPCGFVDKGVTSLQQELGGQVQDMAACQARLREKFHQLFPING